MPSKSYNNASRWQFFPTGIALATWVICLSGFLASPAFSGEAPAAAPKAQAESRSGPKSGSGYAAFTVLSKSVAENAGYVRLTVLRLGGSTGQMIMGCELRHDGTATRDRDFAGAPLGMSWKDGDCSLRTYTVTILDDSLYLDSHKFSTCYEWRLTAVTGQRRV